MTTTHHVNLYYTFSVTVAVDQEHQENAVGAALNEFNQGPPLYRTELELQPQMTQLYPVKIDDDDIMEKMIENMGAEVRYNYDLLRELMDSVSGVEEWIKERYEDEAKEDAITASFEEAEEARMTQ